MNTVHPSFVSEIQDRIVATSDKISTRSRLFGFAKHKTQKSVMSVGDAQKKTDEVGQICEDKENMRPSFRRSRALTVTPFSRGMNSRSRACSAEEGETMKASSLGSVRPNFVEVIKATADNDPTLLAARTPFVSVGNTDVLQAHELADHESRKPVKRGRSPERPKAMQYKRRYSIVLRGLTPSPTRPDRSQDGDVMDVDSSPRARRAEIEEEELMTSPVRRNFRSARRPPTPCRSVALVKSIPLVDEEPLPLTLDKEVTKRLSSSDSRHDTQDVSGDKPCAPLPRGRGRSNTTYSAVRPSFNPIRSSADH